MNIQPGKLKKQRKSAQTAASTLGARLAAVVKFAFFLGIIAAFLNIYIYLNQKISETDRAIRKTGQQIEKTEREIAQLRIRREQLRFIIENSTSAARSNSSSSGCANPHRARSAAWRF